MEKYYLGQLNSQTDLERKIKFVEVQYARRAPSLGLVYLSKARAASKSIHELHMASLELGPNNEAKFAVLEQIKLTNLANVVDFDTLPWVEAENDAGQLNCILLARDTSSGQIGLYNVPLVTGESQGKPLKKINLPPNSITNLQRVTKCQVKQTLLEEETAQGRMIHLLADRCYQSFHVGESNNLVASQNYSINSGSNYIRFVDFFIMDTNQNLALLELSDASLRIVHKSQCLAGFSLLDQLGSVQRHLLLTGDNKNEALLISASQTNLVSHSIQVIEELSKKREDPDNLLPSEPSFELEQCWSLDLNDLDSIRALDSSGKSHKPWACSLCTMRSTDEQSSSSWSKFLIVACQFHLLVYTFEQYNNSQSLPFSIVYDRAFLAKTQPSEVDLLSKKQNFVIDPKLRPKLVHNFKLIGPQPADALFNTLFQARNDRLDQQRHFGHLGLLASLSEAGHLFGFKFTSPKLIQQKDNLYQQLVCESVRGSSRLLIDQLDTQQRYLTELKENIANLETMSSNHKEHERQDLDKLLQAELQQRQDIGGLYNLQLSISNVVHVNQVLVVSTTSSYILKPANLNHINHIHIDNELNKTTKDKPIILTDSSLDLQDEKKVLLDDKSIEACAIIDLDYKFKSIELSLPIFLMDGRFKGQLKVFYILQPGLHLQDDQLQKLPPSIASMLQTEVEDELEKNGTNKSGAVKYHTITLKIKPLISYQIPAHETRLLNQKDHQQLTCQLKGPVNAKVFSSWLQDCVATATTTTTTNLQLQFTSPFTHCTLGFDLRDGELNLSSDDMFALELIKGHILKEATNQGIKLEVNLNPNSPTIEHLKHLIELQTINFDIAHRLREQSELMKSKSKDNYKSKQMELLLESLMSEVSLNSLPFPGEFKPPPLDWIEESFRRDIAQLVTNQDSVSRQNSELGQQQEECTNFTDLVCGFIVDILVDFDRMFGGGGNSQRASADRMIKMRSKILKIIAQYDAAKTFSVVKSIMAAWRD